MSNDTTFCPCAWACGAALGTGSHFAGERLLSCDAPPLPGEARPGADPRISQSMVAKSVDFTAEDSVDFTEVIYVYLCHPELEKLDEKRVSLDRKKYEAHSLNSTATK